MQRKSTRIPRLCATCRKAFLIYPSELAAGLGKFCTRACYDAHRSNRVVRTCARCGTTFSTYASVVKNGGGKHCTRRCRDADWADRALEKFYTQVDRSGECWLWTGPTDYDGYGSIRVAGRSVRVHRYSYEIHHGPIPTGLWVLHKCPGRHNPRCVNPAHLKAGDSTENVNDRTEQGTIPDTKGMKSPLAKLTDADIIEIRRRYAAGGISTYRLAVEFGVTQSSIWQIVARKSWTHLP